MGSQVPLPKGAHPPIFDHVYCCMDQDAIWYGIGLGPGHIVLDGDPDSTPQKGGTPPIFGPCLLCPNGWVDEDATLYEGRPPSDIMLDGDQAPLIMGPCLLWPNGCMDQDE